MYIKNHAPLHVYTLTPPTHTHTQHTHTHINYVAEFIYMGVKN